MKTRFFVHLSVFILALAACRPAATATPDVATQPSPTATALPVADPTATPTSLPTATPTEEPTAVPTAVLTTVEEPETVAFEDLPALVMAAGQPETIFSSVSPDGAWQADIVRYGCAMVDPASGDENAYEMVIITRLSDGVETIAAEQVQYCGGMGSFGFNDFFWSPNSRYYYFDEARESGGVDGMVCGLLNTGFSRIDVETGMREAVPGSGAAYNGSDILAGWAGQEMVITDINATETGRYAFLMDNATLVSYQTSPSGTHVVYILSEGCTAEPGRTMAVLIDLEGDSQTVIAEASMPGFRTASWTGNDRISLLDEDGRTWTYAVASGKLTAP